MRLTPIIPCFLVFTALACGDDEKEDKAEGGGGTGMVNSSVDGSKPLNMLTDAEAQQLAQSYTSAAGTQKLLDGVCMFSAVLSTSIGAADPSAPPTAEQVMACNDAYAMCQMQLDQAQGQAPPPMGGMTVPTSASGFADCGVTVDQYEACLTASIALLEQLYSGLACDKPAMLDTTAGATTPTQCEALSQCSVGAAAGG